MESQSARSSRCRGPLLLYVSDNVDLTTHRDVGESPLRYTRPLRDSVRKTMGQLLPLSEDASNSLPQLEAHIPGERTVEQLVAH
jgi:hypothetical protein